MLREDQTTLRENHCLRTEIGELKAEIETLTAKLDAAQTALKDIENNIFRYTAENGLDQADLFFYELKPETLAMLNMQED